MAAPAPPSSARRWARATALVIALVAAAVGATLAWLQRTEIGSAWVLQQVPGLTTQGVRGHWLGGHFAAERIEWRWGARTLVLQGVAWQDAQWSWRPHDGAWFGLALTAPTVDRASLLGPGSATALARPDSLRLPVALTLQQARIGVLQLDALAPMTQISGTVTLGAKAGAEHRIDELHLRWDRALVQASGRLSADAPFALDLALDARSRDETVPAWRARLGARGPLDKLTLQANLGSDQAPGATLRAEARVLPFATWPLAAMSATASDLDLAALSSQLPRTQISGRADIDSRSLDAPVTARVVLNNLAAGRWDQGRLPVAGLDIELAGQVRDRSHLRVQRFAVQLPSGAGRIEGSGEWQAATAHLALRLQDVKADLLDARAAALTLSGQTTLTLQGLPAPDGSLPAAARQSLQGRTELAGRLATRSTLAVQVSGVAAGERSAAGWQIELSDVLLRSGDARIEGSLAASRGPAGAWRLRTRGELTRFDPSIWSAGPAAGAWRQGPHRLAGRWRADLQGSAPLGAPAQRDVWAMALALRGEAELTLQDSQLAGVPLQAQARLDGRPTGWAVNLDLNAGGNQARLQGQVAPRAQDDRWQFELDARNLALLQPLGPFFPALLGATQPAGSELRGQIVGQLQGQGRWPALALSGDLRASGLQAAGLRAARLQLAGRASPQLDAALALQLGAEQLSVDGLRLDSLQARIDGSLADHRYTLELQSPLRLPAWTDALTGGAAKGTQLRARGSGQWSTAAPRPSLLPGGWRSQALELDAGDTAVAAAATPWLRARELRLQLQWGADGQLLAARAEPGRIEALGAAVRWRDAGWRAASNGVAAEASIDAELEPLAVAPWLTQLRPAAGLGGNLVLGGRARVQVGQRVSADVVLERSSGDLTLTDDTGTQPFGLSDLRLAIAAQDGTWHFTQALAGSNAGVLAGAVSLRLPADARWPRPDTPMQGVLEWQIADLGAWAPFTPPGWRLSGALRTGASIGGSFGAPEVTGEMTGNRLALRNLLQGVDVRDGELALSLRGSEARIDRFVFKGGKGELRLTGGANLGAEPSARLQLVADRFQVLGRLDRRLVSSGNASLTLSPRALELEGRFRVDEGLFDVSLNDAPTLDSDVQVRGGRAAAASQAASQAATSAAAAATRSGTAPRSTRVALQVDLGSELKLRGRGLDTLLRGDLALSTPGGRLAVNGNVRTEAGSYAAYGQKLAIERGVLSFTGPADNARLDILALRPNLDLRVGVLVSGSVQQPRVRLVSEPEMSDTDKLSWLVLGRAPEGLGRTDTALLQRAALALLAGEGEGLDKTLLSNIGLDEFSVRQSETGDVKDTVVSLGKQLSRRWYVGYERGVNSTTGTWQLIYRAAQRFTVRAQAGEDNALDAIWTWRWN